MFKTRKSDGRVFNDNKQRSDKHHGSVKPKTGMKRKDNILLKYELEDPDYRKAQIAHELEMAKDAYKSQKEHEEFMKKLELADKAESVEEINEIFGRPRNFRFDNLLKLESNNTMFRNRMMDYAKRRGITERDGIPIERVIDAVINEDKKRYDMQLINTHDLQKSTKYAGTRADYEKLTNAEKSKMYEVEAKENSAKIVKLIGNHDEDWLIAAMVEGSIGYYSPNIAQNVLKGMKESGSSYSERNMACFRGDAVQELDYDIKQFERLEKTQPEKARELISFVKRAKKVSDFGTNGTFSFLYPAIY